MLTNIFTKSSKYVALALALSSLNACQKKEYEPLYETPTLTSQASGVTTRLTRVQFLNTNVGYVSGLSGVILKTTDAGANWVKQNSGITTNLSSISFANEMLAGNSNIKIGLIPCAWGGSPIKVWEPGATYLNAHPYDDANCGQPPTATSRAG